MYVLSTPYFLLLFLVYFVVFVVGISSFLLMNIY